MKFQRIYSIVVIFLVSSCIEKPVEPQNQSPELSDFKIDNKSYGDLNFIPIPPKSKSQGKITYTSSNGSVADINGDSIRIWDAGFAIITAHQAAFGKYKADSIQANLVVNIKQTSLTNFSIPPKHISDPDFELVAPQTNSRMPFRYTSDNPDVAGIIGNKIKILAGGSTVITAIQDASFDGNFSAASIKATLTVAGIDMVKDYDGNVYKTVKIGDQIWMAENLKTTHYRDGTIIPNPVHDIIWNSMRVGAYRNFNDDDNIANIYGRLYNWNAIVDVHKLAPKGWHIPTKEEWLTLYHRSGGAQDKGVNLMERGAAHWISDPGATDSTSFTALGSGGIIFPDTFAGLKYNGYWWSSTSISDSKAWYWSLYAKGYMDLKEGNKINGFSVRCVKD